MKNQTMPNENWSVAEADGKVPTWERAGIAVLMDIRQELRRLNSAIYCVDFQAIPHRLQMIAKNTTRKSRKKRP